MVLIGHGSSSGPSWGSPAAIDEVYLRNPMEPMDILKLKDSTLESPRRVIGAVKTKTQFNYFRLSEDIIEPRASGASSPAINPIINTISSTSREEPLLIDLSPDLPVSSAADPFKSQPFYQQLIEPLVTLPDQNRLYANYPSPSSPEIATTTITPTASDSLYGPHYYSEVPIEPTSPAFTPPSSKGTSPARPIVTEEFKKKRDEAFDWLGQALGEMTLSKPSGSHHPNYDCITPISAKPAAKPAAHTYGFEDNFSVSTEPAINPSTVNSTSPNGYFRQQQFQRQNHDQIEAARQPFYPKPGVWTDDMSTRSNPSSTSQLYTLPGSSRMAASVQTAHVRPFIMANPFPHSAPPIVEVPDGRASSLLQLVQSTTPWASEAEIKQALVINNGNVTEATRFLQVEKLYR